MGSKWDWSINDTQFVIVIWFAVMGGIAGKHFAFFLGSLVFWYLFAVVGQNITK